jgi:hypothetical protein
MGLSTCPEELVSRIRQIQARLGTPNELPEDFDQLVHLCHRWGNIQQVEISARYLSDTKSPSFFKALQS